MDGAETGEQARVLAPRISTIKLIGKFGQLLKMKESYLAKYRDKFGEEHTTIHNNGHLLSLTVRGVTFEGNDFDSLKATTPLNNPQLETFTLHHGDLRDCEIECDIPMILIDNEDSSESNLHVHLKLGAPRSDGGIENEELQLRLDIDVRSYYSCGQHGWFEDELLEIHEQLSNNRYLKCCFNCAFSDYSPAGSGLFGSMLCFRDSKREYLEVKNKADLLSILEKMTEFVQETYSCSEFEKRLPGTGYRG